MTPRHLSVLSLAILLTLFAVDRGGLISAATMVGGTAIGIRFWLWQASTGSPPTDHARQLLNAGMISVLWLACLSILTTSWFPADSFLPITLLASAWFILDKPPGRHVDTLFVAVNCLASWVIFNVVSLPDPYTIPAAGLVGALALAAFSLLDRQRVAALLGPERLSGGSLGDPVALVLIALITIPIACLAPISSPTTASPVEWSQGLGRIVGFTDSVDLTGLGLL
ncbi:MAG: hypothetical protein VX913_15435, partial [Planctomycetota bacterium]|nr:hypothetical protein [Planctomycetota bacterium]